MVIDLLTKLIDLVREMVKDKKTIMRIKREMREDFLHDSHEFEMRDDQKMCV